MNKMLAFMVGGAVGTAVGAVVSAAFAPQRGDELQQRFRMTIDEVRRAGEEAEIAAREQFRERYRAAVGDPTALADKT